MWKAKKTNEQQQAQTGQIGFATFKHAHRMSAASHRR
jgi:hypothetical protein